MYPQFAIIGCCLATNLLLVNCTATYEKLGGAGKKVNIVHVCRSMKNACSCVTNYNSRPTRSGIIHIFVPPLACGGVSD